MKNAILILFVILTSCFSINGQSSLGVKLDVGTVMTGGSFYNGEKYNQWINDNNVIGIQYGRVISDKLSIMIGANFNKMTSYSSFVSQKVSKDINISCIGPAVNVQYWFKEAHKTGFFLDAGVNVPIVISADELVYKTELMGGFPTFLEMNDFMEQTQGIFPYITFGIGGRWNFFSRLGLEAVISVSGNNNIVDTRNDKEFDVSQYLSFRFFYKL